MNINTLNINEKKRLLDELKEDDNKRIKLDTHNKKYPEFQKKINYINLAIFELKNNINKNNEMIVDLNFKSENKLSLFSISEKSSNDIIENYKDHNKRIDKAINVLKAQIIEIKNNFENYCVHDWINKWEYKQVIDIKNTDMDSYEDCAEKDFDAVKKAVDDVNKCNAYKSYYKNIENVIIKDWKKKQVTELFRDNDCFDRETYYTCKNCNHRHTVNFYSK